VCGLFKFDNVCEIMYRTSLRNFQIFTDFGFYEIRAAEDRGYDELIRIVMPMH
jgi:hypothetical protein